MGVVQGKIIFSQDEMKGIVNNFDEVENELLGFIERVESQLGSQYQFAHLTLMEFCALVHAHNHLSTEEIISNKKLRSCLPMICGLANENERCFVRFLANLKDSNEERNSLLNAVLDKERKMFMEFFFEAQALLTEDLKRSINKREWEIFINYGKTANEVSHQKYFMEKFLYAGRKLARLNVLKNILSEDEKILINLCSTNVQRVSLYHPIKINGWTPKHAIESVFMDFRYTFVTKNEFESLFLPWIHLTEKLDL